MPEPPIILFDGICNYCNAMVNFTIRQDKKKILKFAALQSEAGQKLLDQYGLLKDNFNSFILIDDGRVYKSSTAGLRLYNILPWYWKWTQIFWLVPKFARDAVYNLIAKNRYRWFGKKEKCMVPSPDLIERFIA
jgi:predicted DCC family thiol-disulfide oxidoreductase YuxK